MDPCVKLTAIPTYKQADTSLLKGKASETFVVLPVQREETFDMPKYFAVFLVSLVPVFDLAVLTGISNRSKGSSSPVS